VVEENANIEGKCGKCGTPLAADAPEGLCPRCLMALNLAAQTEAPGDEVGPEGTKVVPPKQEPPPPVDEIARHFPQLEILESLGRGGMGVVYKARQPRLNRFVALKILAREKEKDQRFADRFTREAQALARLNHPNIVTVYDFGETDGLYYLVMEFVDGMNLRQLLQTRKLAPEEALTIVPPICEALQYAHQLGIVHRDIKPENILMDKQGRVKIADYGIAKLVRADGRVESLTGEQGVVGTPHYMAPEQVERPSIVDHRADIFSLGVVFYEMLTGELPLGKFAPPSQKVHMDVRLDEVVLHALEKEPERRYQQASQVKTDVETIARTEGKGGQPGLGYGQAAPPVVANGVESAWRQVKGPGNGLVVTAILNWVAMPVIFLVLAATMRFGGGSFAPGPPLVVPLCIMVLSCIMLVAGLMMKRLGAYGLAIAGAILAILVVPGNVIGLPIGIWALVVLSRREVREAFGKGLPMPRLAPVTGGGWKVAAVIVAGVMLLLAIPVGAILLAIALPNYVKARSRGRQLQVQVVRAAPTFTIRGTVSDAITGQPIAGARVDDNIYGARPARPVQQAWTDAQGHYELRTWPEEHNLAASAAGYQIKLNTLLTRGLHLQKDGKLQMDFQLQPAANTMSVTSTGLTMRLANIVPRTTNTGTAVAGPDAVALGRDVQRGTDAWKSGRYSQAFALLLPAAMQGDPVAQHRIGVMYVMGQGGVAADAAEATRWFRMAAEQGQGESQFSMGMRYLLGQSVVQDNKEALRWFNMAADQGVALAQAALALRYLKGEGAPQDYVEAYKWAKLASDQIAEDDTGLHPAHIGEKLTPDQLAEAQQRVKEFVPKRTAPADP
jgi:TPR repeat protein/tRNA A-37 threonylcarbamoyl transferase component Bud32